MDHGSHASLKLPERRNPGRNPGSHKIWLHQSDKDDKPICRRPTMIIVTTDERTETIPEDGRAENVRTEGWTTPPTLRRECQDWGVDNSSHAAALQKLQSLDSTREWKGRGKPSWMWLSFQQWSPWEMSYLSLLEVFCHRVKSQNRNDSWY